MLWVIETFITHPYEPTTNIIELTCPSVQLHLNFRAQNWRHEHYSYQEALEKLKIFINIMAILRNLTLKYLIFLLEPVYYIKYYLIKSFKLKYLSFFVKLMNKVFIYKSSNHTKFS